MDGYQFLVPLISVVVGGVIALAGGLVGPSYLHRLQQKAAKKQKRAEKFEELVAAVVEHFHWISAMRYFIISGQGSEQSVSPITKIEAIVSTYFPEFEGLVREFDSVSNNYESWILGIGRKRVWNEPGYEDLVGHDDVLSKYTEKRNELLARLRNFARSEFQ